MQEKLSVRKVYRNAGRYVGGHLPAFAFLTVFYFIGSLLPMLFGQPSFQLLSLICMYFYMYLFFYFAAGFYFKQQLLWNKKIFLAAGSRFLTAVFLFLSSIFLTSLGINTLIYLLKTVFADNGDMIVRTLLNSPAGLIVKYLVIFLLFIVFFIIPSFAFISEITGKGRSLMTTYAKTKGNLPQIALVALGAFAAFALLLAVLVCLTATGIWITAIIRAGFFAFVSILYFKMYEFFYTYPVGRRKMTKNTAGAAELKKNSSTTGIKSGVAVRQTKLSEQGAEDAGER